MTNPSPGSGEKTGRLVAVALFGIGILVATAWIVLRNADPAASRPPAANGPAAAVSAPPDATAIAPTTQDVDLVARVRAEIERAVAPVRVTLPILGPDGEPALDATITSDPELGALTGLTRELASLLVEARGAATLHLERVVLPGADVTLPPVRLSKGALLRGRVQTADGSPVAQAAVELYEAGHDLLPLRPLPPPKEGARARLGATRSDDRGEFQFDHVAVRHVSLLARPPEARRGDLANSWLAETTVGEPATLTLERREADAEIGGVAVDAAGTPLRDFSLLAIVAIGEASSFDAQPRGAQDGVFALRALADGYAVVTAEAEGFARTVLPRVHTGVAGLRVVLRRLAAGKATLLGAPGGLDVPVTWRALAPSGAHQRPVGAPQFAWMRDGELRIEGVAAGAFALELSIPGAMPIVTPVVEFVLDAVTELGSFSLQAGATLAVTVRDRDGKPLAARVALAAPHHAAIALARDVFALPDHRERLCGADGRLDWIALPPGERVLAFRHPGFADRNVKVALPASGLVTLPPVVLARAGAIEGSLHTPTGSPLGEIELTARHLAGSDAPPTPDRSARSDLEGRFEFPQLEPGRWEITLLPRDEAPPTDLAEALAPRENVTKVVDVPAGAPTRCDFTWSGR